MKRLTNMFRFVLVFGLTTLLFSSCVKKDFDQPVTANVDPGLTVTHTLGQLEALATGLSLHQITTDIIIAGVVVADDSSGNFYKEIIIQDSTAGLSVQVDMTNYYSNYPIGRRLFIKCKGLYIANDGNGNYQLGTSEAGAIGRIPSTLVPQYIYKGMWGQYFTPTPVSLSPTASNSINNAKTQTLVLLSNVEFKGSDYGVPYADAATLTYKNRVVGDCATPFNSMVLYTSGYAKFANSRTPSGNGTMVAVYKLYRGAGELQIRDVRDVNMPSLRCDGTTGNLTQIPIDSLRMLYTGTATTAPAGRKIKGIVISDNAHGNIDPKNVVIQDSTAGIVVRFSAAHSLPLGAQVEINVSGLALSPFNGLLQVSGADPVAPNVTGTGTISPRVATIGQILSNYGAWESTLLKIQNATITGPTTTYSGSNTLTDSTATITLFTKFSVPAATFGSVVFPTGPVSVTGILGQYSPSTFTPQISMRDTSDVH